MNCYTVKVLDVEGAEHLIPAQSVTHRIGKLTLVTPSGTMRTVDVVEVACVKNPAGQTVATYRAGQYRPARRPQADSPQHKVGGV